MRFSRPLFLAGFIALAGVAGLARPASRAGLPFPLQLEMRVPFEPTAFPSGGQTYLAYELYLTNFRPPDIEPCEIVRFRCGSRGWGSGWGSAAAGRRAWEGEADARWRLSCEADAKARTWEDRRRLVEELAQSLRGARSMRRTEGSQCDVQLRVAEADVAGCAKQLM